MQNVIKGIITARVMTYTDKGNRQQRYFIPHIWIVIISKTR